MKAPRVAILDKFPLTALSGDSVGHGDKYSCLGQHARNDRPPQGGSNHTLMLVEEI